MTAKVVETSAQLLSWARVSQKGFEPNRHWPHDETDPDASQVSCAREWIRLFTERTANFQPRHSSYDYKHDVERWSRKYISNGAFIAAALAEGVTAKRCEARSLNAFFALRPSAHSRRGPLFVRAQERLWAQKERALLRAQLAERAAKEKADEEREIAQADLPPAAILDVVPGRRAVYVVWSDGDVYAKIGQTENTFARLAALQTGNPRPLHLLVRFPETHMGWDERRLHRRFAAQRVSGGEWFRLEGAFEQWLRPALEANGGTVGR